MNIRRLVLDVDKAWGRSSVPEIGEPIAKCPGAEAFTVGVIDSEIMGMDTIEGAGRSYHGGQP